MVLRRHWLEGGALLVLVALGLVSLRYRARSPTSPAIPILTSAQARSSPSASSAAPPDASSLLAPSLHQEPDEENLLARRKCPPEMVSIAGTYCIDRWEDMLVDRATGHPLSPYYPPDRALALKLEARWNTQRTTLGDASARVMSIPPLPDFQRTAQIDPMAVSKPGVIPNGYLSGLVAARACANAGKRLCRHDEWRRACMGQAQQPYPYGDEYHPGLCNIFRAHHPAAVLHGDASQGHLDPRLNLVADEQGPLLRKTGATKSCASRWGDDAAYDMNGNLDEWVDDDDGLFVGGFFSRAKRDGCNSAVRNHPTYYFDYSTGVRCCSDGTLQSPQEAPSSERAP